MTKNRFPACIKKFLQNLVGDELAEKIYISIPVKEARGKHASKLNPGKQPQIDVVRKLSEEIVVFELLVDDDKDIIHIAQNNYIVCIKVPDFGINEPFDLSAAVRKQIEIYEKKSAASAPEPLANNSALQNQAPSNEMVSAPKRQRLNELPQFVKQN